LAETALTPFRIARPVLALFSNSALIHDRHMPRRPRSFLPNTPVHVMQRGVDRQRCFRQDKDFRSYLAALRETSDHYCVSIHAYVLMTNHVHILANPECEESISQMMQQLGRKYVSYFNKEHGRTGPLWEGRFRSSVICSDRYLFACCRYIELNPVRAGLAQSAREYRWSSYSVNAMALPDGLIRPSPMWLALGNTAPERSRRYRRIFSDVAHDHDDQLRTAIKKGTALK
jgi:putative transposase